MISPHMQTRCIKYINLIMDRYVEPTGSALILLHVLSASTLLFESFCNVSSLDKTHIGY